MSESRTITDEWKWRRREVIIRDDYACQRCGAKGGPEGNADLEVHHITPVAKGGTDGSENLETLCSDCHNQSHANLEGNHDHFEQKYPPEDFVAAVEGLELPTTSEVAEYVGCAHRTALHHLNQLEDNGRLTSRMAGRAKIWAVAEAEGDA
jgi:hypothetical protein